MTRSVHSKAPSPGVSVDLTGRRCVMLLTALKEAVEGVAPGQRLTVRTDDPAAETAISRWCADTGHTLIAAETIDGVLQVTVECR